MTIHARRQLPSGTIVLKRPEKRNALNRRMIADLSEALEDFHQERKVRAVIITGSGSAFCAGMDLAEMQETAEQPDAQQRWHEDAEIYRELLEKMLRYPKPLIAAVNGPAVAGGAGLLLACDVVLGTPEARFGLPEPRRGIIAGMVAPLLAFRLGAGQAARLLLTAEMIDAAEAHRIGLYHEITSIEMNWARAHEVATLMAKSAGESLQLTKKLLNETVGENLFSQLFSGAAASATARTTEAALEGLKAFIEKRDPNWP